MKIGALFAVGFLGVLGILACTATPAAADRSVTAEAPGFDSVMAKEWRLAELKDGTGVVFSRDRLAAEFANSYTLRFQDGMASGRGAPNIYRSPFEQGPNQGLSIRSGAATLMAPIVEPEGLTEGDYFGYLGRVYRWDLNAGALELHTTGKNGEAAVLVYR
jgi:hypothetical protein